MSNDDSILFQELRRVIDELRLEIQEQTQHINALCAALTSLLMKKEKAAKRKTTSRKPSPK